MRVIRDVGSLLVTENQRTASQQRLCIKWISYSKAYAGLQPVSKRGWLSSKREVLILHGLWVFGVQKHSQAAYNWLWSHPRWPSKVTADDLGEGWSLERRDALNG